MSVNITLHPKGPLPADAILPTPRYSDIEMSSQVDTLTYTPPEGELDYYPGPMIGADSLGRIFSAQSSHYVRMAIDLLRKLDSDSYTRYLEGYYTEGLKRFGDGWGYSDIVTVLLGLSGHLRPIDYLEIGVRRGRSACALGSIAPDCNMVLFDMWLPNYAGMDNPGQDLVLAELAKVGHRGKVTFVDGNSHQTVPAYFEANPEAAFDIITVDGDHTNLGAAQDLSDVMPRLKIGGALVFDDICHPKHPGLADVWRRMVEEDRRFTYYNFSSAGYGVGFAIRRR